jgi:hypothetical protein
LEVGGFSSVLLEGASAVVGGVAVDLDDEVVVGPEGVDLVAVEAGVVDRLGRRRALRMSCRSRRSASWRVKPLCSVARRWSWAAPGFPWCWARKASRLLVVVSRRA